MWSGHSPSKTKSTQDLTPRCNLCTWMMASGQHPSAPVSLETESKCRRRGPMCLRVDTAHTHPAAQSPGTGKSQFPPPPSPTQQHLHFCIIQRSVPQSSKLGSKHHHPASQVVSSEESPCQGRRLGLDPCVGRSSGGGNGNPLQYSCWRNPTDRAAWWATVHGVAKRQTRLSDWACMQASPSCPHLIVISLLNKKCFSIISQFHVQIHRFPVDFYVNLKEKHTSPWQETSRGMPRSLHTLQLHTPPNISQSLISTGQSGPLRNRV